MQVAVDSSILVGLLNPADRWHEAAVRLRHALLDEDNELFYFDCVVAEAASVAIRRLYEKKRKQDVSLLLQRLNEYATVNTITWVLPDVPRLYPEIIGLMRSSGGELNFHDALIALACRERNIPAIASFDGDFDQLSWLRRLATPADLAVD